MFLPQDFKYLKPKTNNKLLLFPRKVWQQENQSQSHEKKEQGYFQNFKTTAEDFLCYFGMHGVNRMFQKDLNKFKRVTWIIGFFVCLWVFIYVSYQVASIYHTKPLVTVVSILRLPVYRIPFPEVTICNKNRFNWQRYGLAKKVFLRPEHHLIPEYENIFMEVVNAYDTLAFGQFYKFENLSKIPHGLLQDLNYVNFQLVSEFMAWKCHEMFSTCKWLYDDYNCCDIFFRRNSPLGTCLAFNSIESPEGLDKQRQDPFWPWRTKDRGFYNGLAVRIHLREQYLSPKAQKEMGVLVMLTEPNIWYNRPIEVGTHTQTSISIKPTLHSFSNYTRIISPQVRQCLFDDELRNEQYKTLPNRVYMIENCRSQCLQEYLTKLCNCSLDLFYPIGLYRSCKLVDYPCLYYHSDKFQFLERTASSKRISKEMSDVMKCTCFYNCNSLTYAPTVSTSYMSNTEVNSNNSYIDLNVFFQKEFLMVLLTTVFYSLTDLMASFGGLAGLCIGCSLLSVVEILYFFAFNVPYKTWLYYKRVKLAGKRRKAKVDVVENVLKY